MYFLFKGDINIYLFNLFIKPKPAFIRPFIVLFVALLNGQYAQAGPCKVETVTDGLHLFNSAGKMVVTPNNQWVLVLDESASEVKIIEAATQQVLTSLYLPDLEPGGLTLSTEGTKLYVSGIVNGNVAVADISAPDPSQWTITDIWEIPGDFGAMLFDPNTPRLLVTDRQVQGVRVLSSTDGSELATLSVAHCELPSDLVRQGSLLFVACETSNKVAVFDLETMGYRSGINVGTAPVALLLHPTLPRLYVANMRGGSMSLINTENLELIKLNLTHPTLSSPTDLLWLNGTIWILDQSAAALVAFEPRTEAFNSSICTGIADKPSHLAKVTLPAKTVIYAAHLNGVDYMSIDIRKARFQPQVLMAGFDPILLDLGDTTFSVLAVIEEGIAELNAVSIEQNLDGGLEYGMTLVGSIPLVVEEDRQIQGLVYEMVIKIPRGAFPPGTVATEVMGLPTLSLFGDKRGQFKIRAWDNAEQQHSYPEWKYGHWPINETKDTGTAATLYHYGKRGPRRALPQVIMAGFAPMLMDIADTELTVLAIVRPGMAKIRNVTLKTPAGRLFTAMNQISELPNGDELYEGTVATQRRGQPLFPAEYEFYGVWNDMFQIVVVDEDQQTHQFPDFRVGLYPEID
ncbi:MAG: hypothetical protein DRR19_03410 [Candidatus Parabeggiatoa sp. nov. 1]|nr:MAG: hypothetical protein DRR19_03410 [Gammaproteobacteria bacterium]